MTPLVWSRPQLNLYVDDVEGVARFYLLLGFVEVQRRPPGVNGEAPSESGTAADLVELVLEGLALTLIDAAAARASHGLEVGPPSARAEIVVRTDDADQRFVDLVGAGARVVQAPRALTSQVRAAWIADPAGNVVQLLSHRLPDPTTWPGDSPSHRSGPGAVTR